MWDIIWCVRRCLLPQDLHFTILDLSSWERQNSLLNFDLWHTKQIHLKYSPLDILSTISKSAWLHRYTLESSSISILSLESTSVFRALFHNFSTYFDWYMWNKWVFACSVSLSDNAVEISSSCLVFCLFLVFFGFEVFYARLAFSLFTASLR